MNIYEKLLNNQRKYLSDKGTIDVNTRIENLKKLKNNIKKYEIDIIEALNKDLGKHEFEAYSNEVGFVYSSIEHTIKNIKNWMKPKKVKNDAAQLPGKSYIYKSHYGSVLIIGPYNYPFQLLIEPLIGAIGGGNTVILKPSEYATNIEYIVEKIIKTTLRDRQLLGFTASLDEKAESFCDYMMKDMEIIKATDNSVINPNINHLYIYGDRREKFTNLRKALASAKPKRSIVFVNDEASIEVINEKLNYHKYKSVCISGKMSKEDRKNAMTAFRSGKANILVSSDLSARGLDIPDVSHVFNLDFPLSKNEYLHRCGRSARGNKKGTAISIITNQNLGTIRDYKRQFKINMKAVEIKEGKFVDVDFKQLKKEAKAKRENKNK